MLNIIGHIAGMAVIMVDAVAILFVLQLTLRQRIIGAAVAGGWVGLATALAATGALAFSPRNPVPLIGLLCTVPLVVTGALWLTAPKVRAALLAIPTSLLIGLNTLRVIGVLFLALDFAGRLSGPFPIFAGLGDVVTGLLAIPLVLRVARGHYAGVASWNAFGLLDLLVAMGLGVASSQGSMQLLHVGVGSLATQYLPFSLVPTVMVPFYLITHGIVAAQLAARRSAISPNRGPVGAAQFEQSVR